MSSFVAQSLFTIRNGRRRTDRLRTSRCFRFGLELLEDRITPTSVTGLSPAMGPAIGGTLVTITGTGFTGVTAVDFGTTPATSDTVSSATTITAESPAGTGIVDVTVTASGGTSATSPADEFTYVPAVSSVSPTAGPLGGGTLVTINGSGFTGATTVDFGTTPATSFTFVSDNLITADSPAGAAGAVDVTVTTPDGTSATSPADQFTYTAAPTVSGLSPVSGPTAGGTSVTIIGSGFTGATAVDFGTTPATNLTIDSDTLITVDSPAGTPGTVDVTVTALGGTSATSPADQFTYVTAPTVSGLSPTSGPPAGGTLVTIIGSGFTGATAVDFGTTPATNLTVVSATTITADSPAGAGVVNVTVTTPGGTSATSPADQFTYEPSVTGVSPASGPPGGGTLVTITGIGFTGATAVDFGTTPATNLTVVSATTITVDSPAGAGTVDVTVTTPIGTSVTSAADQFTYVTSPTVLGLIPNGGSVAGGTLVTIIGSGFTGATAVDFGTAPATSLTVVNDTTITVDSPAGAGVVDVTVTTPGGTSATSPADLYVYAASGAVMPRVSGISPTFGPPGGGTLVTITGIGFDPTTPTSVYFGTTPAQSVAVVSATTIVAESPAGAGAVDVTVITYGGASAASPADVFTYTVDGPQVTSVQRYGYHAQPTYLVISFNQSLDPSPAHHVSNYLIVGPGGNRIKVKRAIYNSATDAVTLVLTKQLVLRETYGLTINGTTPSGLTNRAGLLLDGASTGQPGSNYVTTVTKADLAGKASQRPIAAVVKARAKSLIIRVKSALHTHEATDRLAVMARHRPGR